MILYLGQNEFTGSIPTELGQMTELSELNLYENSFSEMGSFPSGDCP